jgi:hypothetical protein
MAMSARKARHFVGWLLFLAPPSILFGFLIGLSIWWLIGEVSQALSNLPPYDFRNWPSAILGSAIGLTIGFAWFALCRWLLRDV